MSSIAPPRPLRVTAPAPRVSTAVGAIAASVVAGFVLTSALVATLPHFRFDSQVPTLLPFAAWIAAAGVGHVANLASTLHRPWREAGGVASVVPYAVVMVAAAAAPGAVPWWLSFVVAAVAMVPFVALARRSATPLAIDPLGDTDPVSRRGTLLVGVALMVLTYAVGGPTFAGSLLAVASAVALVIAGLLHHGLARASQTWRLRHWAALAWGSLVVWATLLVRGTTPVFDQVGWLILAVVVAGLPLVLLQAQESRGR